MTDELTIDRLAEEARAAGTEDRDAQAALWRALFTLERWWFPTTEGDDPRPFLGVVPEGPALLAFTTGQRARAWALGNGFDEERAGRVIAMTPDSTVDFLEKAVPEAVRLLVVDPGVTGFFAPRENLRAIQQAVAE